MAIPEEWLVAGIEAAAEIQTFPLYAPEGAPLPYAIYQRAATDRSAMLSGLANRPVGEFAVTLYADSYSAVKALSDAVRVGLNDFNGAVGELTIGSVRLTDERDGDPVFFDGRDSAVYVVEHTYSIEWEE